MPILVHITQQAYNDGKRHGIADDRLRQFADRIEETQLLESFERNNPYPCLVKKQFYGRDKRLVAMQRNVENDTVIVLLRLLIRGSSEYADNFEGKRTEETTLRYLDTQYRNELDDDRLMAIVKERNRKAPPPALPAVSSEEEGFLWSPIYAGFDDDTLVCESHEFVEDIGRPELKTQLVRVPEMVIEAVGAEPNQVSIITSSQNSRLVLIVYNSPSTDQCVLLRLLHACSEGELATIRSDWHGKLDGCDHLRLLRFCRVSYPSLVCGDEQIWVSIHDNADDFENIANLSLSPEEGDILNSCDMHEGKRSGFPLFINGRAGSGKSTLLQYLFAFCFQRWLATLAPSAGIASCPLYMASSKTLLDIAHRSALSILSMNSQRLLEEQVFDEAARETLAGCFKQTSEYLHSLLSSGDQKKFSFENRIDYASFRRLWDKQFGKEPRALRDYGPQVSWHIIRGLIKGFSPAELLEADEYEDLPKDERSVSKATFQLVHDRVWEKWYKPLCSSRQMWDDQDLVRYLLEHELLPRTHVAVFCDEAQDFTRVELEALYRCSVFSNRMLVSQSIKRIPFVFAGDPFQTLNPTGFRWESVQAAFTERIVESLYRFDRRTTVPELHYEELTFNYRSAKRIVHFCNSIQASRALLFDHTSLRPQATWRIQDDQSAPVFLDKADVQVRQSLKEQSDLVLIVPCEEGEETEFVSNDCFLKDIVELDDEGVPLNVQSASRSKGLEFRRVALYGWSERPEAQRIAQLLRKDAKVNVDIDEKLHLEYFMNNLYVAASRAQRRLFVLDDKGSLDGLWWIVHDQEHIQKILVGLPDAWQSQVGTMVSGGSDSFQFDKDTNKRRAEQQKAEGLAKQSAFTLKQAAQYFELDDNLVEANRCRGLAFLYAQRYKESARYFEDAGDHTDAVGSLWRGRHFPEIAEFVRRHPEQASLPECETATFLTDPDATSRECVELLQNLSETTSRDDRRSSDLRNQLWSDAVERVLKKTRDNMRAQGSSAIEADLIADKLDELLVHGLSVDNTVLAAIHFQAENYKKVVELLADSPSSGLYRDARALSVLSAADSGKSISQDDAAMVGDYLLRRVRPEYGRASEYFARSGELGKQLDCLREATDADGIRDNELLEVLAFAVDGTLEHSDWRNLISILTRGQPKEALSSPKRRRSKTSEKHRILKLISKAELPWKKVIPYLAKSKSLSDVTGQDKQQVQEYLKGLVGNQDWRKYVHPAVMGAAIERAGKDIDALVFYEEWKNRDIRPDEKRYAQVRWVVCKLRQAERQNSSSNRKEAQRVMEKYDWDDDVTRDEYPNLEDGERFQPPKIGGELLETGSSEQAPVQLHDRQTTVIGDLEFKFVRLKGWVNIESDDGLRARVVISEQRIESLDVQFLDLEDKSSKCDQWNLHVIWMPKCIVKLKCAGQELFTPPLD